MSVGLWAVFGAGLLTYLTPCVLPLIPLYLAALAGGDVRGLSEVPRSRLIGRALLFVLGFSLVFTAMGLVASTIGTWLAAWRLQLQGLGAAVILVFALKLLGVIEVPWLDRVVRARESRDSAGAINAVAMGIVFAAGWSPCVGPVLGSVLTYAAAQASDPWVGAGTLAVYAAGFSVPLLVTTAFVGRALTTLRRMSRWLPTLERVTGALLLLAGLGLLFDAIPSVPGTVTRPAIAADRTAVVEARPRMLELYSADCPICRDMAPVVERIGADCDGRGVTIDTVDISNPAFRPLASRYRLLGVPTFLFFDADGTELARLVGRQSETTLRQTLSALRGESCENIGPVPPADLSQPDLETESCPSTNTSATTARSASRHSSARPSVAATSPAPAEAAGAACSADLP